MRLISKFNYLIFAAAVVFSGAVFAGAHSEGEAQDVSGDGHCNYTQENMFAGPFKVCQMPVGAEGCKVLGDTDDNADALHGDGDCAADGSVGTCDMGDQKVVYYEGDPGGLEIGCGFQGGDWITS